MTCVETDLADLLRLTQVDSTIKYPARAHANLGDIARVFQLGAAVDALP